MRGRCRESALVVALCAIAGCASANLAEERDRRFPPIPRGLDLYVPVPDSNPLREDLIVLGRRLFTDRRLSRDGSLSCASCHDPRRAFSSSEPRAVGVLGRVGRRNHSLPHQSTAGSVRHPHDRGRSAERGRFAIVKAGGIRPESARTFCAP